MKKTSEEELAVSVLVPIYNVEKYLRQCLQSLHEQTLQNIEFICINDGSTDGSLEIVKEFMELDPRFKLLDKENSGYGDSMNQGLKKAKGEYIGIVESDDWIGSKAFEDLYNLAKKDNADIVRANYFQNKGGVDTKISSIPMFETEHVVNPLNRTWLFLLSPAIWSAIYRREFLLENDLKFLPTPGAAYQDTGFAFKTFAAAKSVRLTTNAYLHYRIDNVNSSVNQKDKALYVRKEYESIAEFLKERGLYDRLRIIYWAGKCNTYCWNALRLSPEVLKPFLEEIMPEIQKAESEGLVFPEYYVSLVGRMMQALVDGDIELAVRIAQDNETQRVKGEKYQNSKFHIYRTKAIVIERLLTKLESQNELLEQQIRNLKAKMEQKNVEE